MVAVPFIYFIVLFYIFYRRASYKIDIACFIIIIYGVSSFFSILVDIFHLRSYDNWNYEVSFLPTIAYLGLITLGVLPFTKVPSVSIHHISKLKNDKILRVVAWVAFLFFILDLWMNIATLIRILSGDLAEIRELVYKGEIEGGWLGKIPSKLLRIPFILLNFSTGSFWIFIFLGFYSRYIQRMPKYYLLLYLGASLKYVVGSLLLAGRSAVAYWVLGFALCYLLFRPFFNKEEKKRLWLSVAPFVLLGFVYLSTVTGGRFGDGVSSGISGTQSSLISYFGQSYINFCYFWETFESPVFYWQDVFPFLGELLGVSINGGTAVNADLSDITGIQIGVFYTYIGNIQIATNKTVAIMYCLVLFFLASLSIKKKIKKCANIFDCYLYLLFSSVMVLGVFTSFYMTAQMTFSAILFVFILKHISTKKNLLYK